MRNRSIRRQKRKERYSDGEDVNPMNYVSNLSDVMLILAVGIMLALIIHWNVNIEPAESSTESDKTEAISFSDDDLQALEELPEDMQQMGEVYYDSVTGKYYIIKTGSTGE